MHAPAVAQALRDLEYDVVAVAESPDLRAMTDGELFTWAARQRRRIVTENVKDCRRLQLRAEESGQRRPGLLFTSSRTFSRSRGNPGPLIAALNTWLGRADSATRPAQDWLRPA